jgi:hypothetical protein
MSQESVRRLASKISSTLPLSKLGLAYILATYIISFSTMKKKY